MRHGIGHNIIHKLYFPSTNTLVNSFILNNGTSKGSKNKNCDSFKTHCMLCNRTQVTLAMRTRSRTFGMFDIPCAIFRVLLINRIISCSRQDNRIAKHLMITLKQCRTLIN